MEYKPLGKTGEKLPAIGIGTWKMLSGATDITAIRNAVAQGMTLVDTAEMYGNEEMVGHAIKGLDVFLATKVSPHNFKYDDVIKACNASLQRLGVKQIDLYQLHWPNHSVPIGETMRAMEKLKKDGKIRHIGVSNFDVGEFEEAQAALKNDDIVSNQVEYSILVRDVESELLGYCKKNKVTVIAYSPLARGALFDKRYQKLAESLKKIGSKHGKTASQVALNWLIAKENVIAIPKASTEQHIIENAGAAGWKLSADDMSEINTFLSGIRKRPLASVFTPIIKHSGFWSKRMTSRNQNRNKYQS
ncbi:MAG TPA: aldo/keto reductase [Candidatus Acidoferrum sp.]|nr:aldo/keto reductase [Candidatus Acidoferrum sp.]